MSLPKLWQIRDLVEADLHQAYGLDVDLAEPLGHPLLAARSWRWLLVRLLGLATTTETRVWAALAPDPEPVTPTAATE